MSERAVTPSYRRNAGAEQGSRELLPSTPTRDSDETGSDSDVDSEDASTIDASEREQQRRNKQWNQRNHFDLCDTLHKRRHGFKRNARNNWVQRCFTLYGSVLCYYDKPDMEHADPSRPRRRIDLAKEDTIADMHSMHKPGAPSEFLITINIYVLGGKRKWEICCKDKTQQEKWYEAIRRFDGKPDDISSSPNLPTENKNKVKSPLAAQKKRGGSFGKKSKKMNDNLGSLTVSISDGSILEKVDKDLVIFFGILNFAVYLVRTGSAGIFWITIFVANLALVYGWLKKTALPDPPSRSRLRSVSYEGLEDTADELVFEKPVPAGSTISRATPEDSTAETIKEHGTDSATAIRAYAATDASYELIPHTYWNVNASVFNLRIGPNYKRNKQKAPSAPALYDLYAVDFIRAKTVLQKSEDAFIVPNIPGVTDIDTGNTHVPPMFIISCSMPSEEPSMFNNPFDGPSFIAILYLMISPKTIEELKDLEKASPAVKLFAEWCQRAETDDTFRGRFKAMCVLDDIESLGLPNFIAGYNGKPALISRSGTFIRQSNYIEMSINVHYFAYLARKCLYSLHNKFSSFILNVGFTIEGRDDDELPEVLLGGCRMINLDLNKAKTAGIVSPME